MEARNQIRNTITDFTVLRWDCQQQPPEVFFKKAVLKKFTIFTKNTCVGASFLKCCRSEGLQLYWKESPTQVLSCEYYRSFNTTFSKNICEWLLFDFFNVSLLHGPKGSRSRLYDGVRLQGLRHRSSFLFLSWHQPSPSPQPAFENLRRIPLMSQLSFYIGYFWSF